VPWHLCVLASLRPGVKILAQSPTGLPNLFGPNRSHPAKRKHPIRAIRVIRVIRDSDTPLHPKLPATVPGGGLKAMPALLQPSAGDSIPYRPHLKA